MRARSNGEFSGSCQEKVWFYDLDLSQTLGRAAWEILTARNEERPPYEEVCELTEDEWVSWLDEALHNKALWVVVEEVSQQDSNVQEKIYTSLK